MDIKDTADGNTITDSSRLLLPFTHGVYSQALEYAVLLARNCNATLVPLSLIPVPQTARSVRLEHIQQSKDFQALVQSKAAKYGVGIEPHEVYTSDVIQSIHSTMQEMSCSNIVLFLRDGDGILLHTHEVKHILTRVSGQHHVIRLQRNAPRPLVNPLKRLSYIFSGHRKEHTTMETSFS